MVKNKYITDILDNMLFNHIYSRKINKGQSFMPFNIDFLRSEKGFKRFGFSHYYKHDSGDMIPDPDMEVYYNPETKELNALTYQDAFRYDEEGTPGLNGFLKTWLNNVVEQQGLKTYDSETELEPETIETPETNSESNPEFTLNLATFIERFKKPIADNIYSRFTPLYGADSDTEQQNIEILQLQIRKENMKSPLFHAQAEVTKACKILLNDHHGKCVFVIGEMGTGKAQPLYSKILTSNGWTTMKNLRVGDSIIGFNGEKTKVIGIYPQGKKDIYRVTFSDNTTTDCCIDHLWNVRSPLDKWKKKSFKTLSLKKIIEKGLNHKNGNYQNFIPIVKPIQFKDKNLPIDPYVLGILLSDGCFSSNNLSVSKNEYRNIIKSLGLSECKSETKFIPDEYLFSSIQQRIKLLQGMLDGDGYIEDNANTIKYVTLSPILADHVTFLVQSLGGTVNLRIKEKPTYFYNGEKRIGQKAYRLFISLPNNIIPFKLSRKANRYIRKAKYHPARAIVSIKKIGYGETQCIKVDAEDGLYITDNCIVTHNTSIANALIHIMKHLAKINLIICPPHLVGKWEREIKETMPKQLSLQVFNIKSISDFEKASVEAQLYDKSFFILSREKSKLSYYWKPDYMLKKVWVTVKIKDQEGYVRTEKQLIALPHCPKCQKMITDKKTGTSLEIKHLKNRKLFCQEEYTEKVQAGDNSFTEVTKKCGNPLWTVDREGPRRYALADYIAKRYRNYFDTLVIDECFPGDTLISTPQGNKPIKNIVLNDIVLSYNNKNEIVERKVLRTIKLKRNRPIIKVTHEKGFFFCTPDHKIFTDKGYKTAISLKKEDYLIFKENYEQKSKHCKKSLVISVEESNRIDDYVYDLEIEDTHCYFANGVLVSNCHEYKSHGSAQGQVIGTLSGACKKTIALTGTIFGGRSSSLFYLLHRFSPEFKKKFKYTDETEFVKKYGIQWRIHKETDIQTDGRSSKRRITPSRIEEKPGISPEIILYLIDKAVFINLNDIDDSLPPYNEYPVEIAMLPEQKNRYKAIESEFKAKLALALAKNDKRLLSQYLQVCLTYPDLPADPKIIYPKEQALIDLVSSQRQQGRKTLVYCTHTDKRDITPRLKEVLEAKGIKVETLKSSVKAEKREQWIKDKVQSGIDVLICNPALVKTGLDLIDFPNIFFYEIDFNIYTMRQASRRSWRIGQDQPVNIYFACYKDTMQEKALSLVAKKLKAAEMIDGELTEDGLSSYQDEGSLLVEIAKSMVENIREDCCLEGIFKNGNLLDKKPEIKPQELPKLIIAPIKEEKPANDLWNILYAEKIAMSSSKPIRKKVTCEAQEALF